MADDVKRRAPDDSGRQPPRVTSRICKAGSGLAVSATRREPYLGIALVAVKDDDVFDRGVDRRIAKLAGSALQVVHVVGLDKSTHPLQLAIFGR